MLFLNTLHVSAIDSYIVQNINASCNLNNNVNGIYSPNGANKNIIVDIDVPCFLKTDNFSLGDYTRYSLVYVTMNCSFEINCFGCPMSGFSIYDFNNNPCDTTGYTNNYYGIYRGSFSYRSDIFTLSKYLTYQGNDLYTLSLPFYVRGFLTDCSSYSSYTFNYKLNTTNLSIGLANSSDLQTYSSLTSDNATREAVESGNAISESIRDTQEELQETAEDTNETTHGILSSITSFFGSFFSNLIGVFVPESGYFENWFSRVDTMLSNKLGILYWPFNKIIAFFNRLSDSVSSQSNVTITFPAIEFTNVATGETYHFLDEQSVNLEYYNYRIPLSGGSPNSDLVGTNRFNSLVSIVRTFNSAVLIFGTI